MTLPGVPQVGLFGVAAQGHVDSVVHLCAPHRLADPPVPVVGVAENRHTSTKRVPADLTLTRYKKRE